MVDSNNQGSLKGELGLFLPTVVTTTILSLKMGELLYCLIVLP